MVHFEDLGPLMRSRSNVPVVGNIMASRWAYEALAVDQFKNNDYEAQFFDVDAKLKNSKYRKDFWMEQMKNQAAIAENLTHEAHPSADSIAQYDAFFKSEFRSFKEEYPAINIVNIASLSLAANAPTFLQAINTNLDNIATTMIAIHNNAMADKNKLTEKLNKDLGGNEQALIYKNKYHNEPLEKQVCNDLAKDQTLFSDNAIIRKYHPVFYKSLSASAPFYAHTKTCFGMQIETLWFNIVFIWLMTGVLYITLYFDVLRRVLEKK